MSETTKPTNQEAFKSFIKKYNLEVSSIEAQNVFLFELDQRISRLEL